MIDTHESIVLAHYHQILGEIAPKTLVAVTKYTPLSDLLILYRAGHRDFGESRVQDLQEKSFELEAQGITDVRWHFIGHLQRNKVRTLMKVPGLFLVHSVDSKRLYQEFLKESHELKSPLSFLIQVNTSLESEKGGVLPSELESLLEFVRANASVNLNLLGLMAMGSIRTDDFIKSAHHSFSKLNELSKKMADKFAQKPLLSMGMSDDYKIALLYQTDFVRIGGAIFSPTKS